ncbi:divalent metal cation transporter, partial [Pinirhizobacter sp.]|uniref:divalent metal cation transporter n=1 Tax=Pinirhizobacter sp. TaxID=2950432 RepID=UPI002F428437
RQAPMFYGVLVATMLLGAGLNLTPIDPFKALYWSAVVNGIAAVPMMIMILLLAQNKKVLKEFTISGWLKFLAWAATIVMAVAALIMIATLGQS